MDEYTTTDIGVSAALLTLGIHLLRVEKEDTKIVFVFEGSEEVTRIEQDFYTGLMVPAREYNDSIRAVKSHISSLRKY